MIRCPDKATLWKFLRDELGAEASQTVNVHVEQCPRCNEALAEMTGLVGGWWGLVADSSDVPEVPGYQVTEAVGQGGMGTVWRALHLALDRVLAVKVLRTEFGGLPSARRRFLEEAHIAGRLQHPGVVPIHELGELPDGRPFFAMKLVEGRTFADLLAARNSPEDDQPSLLQIFEQVCQTLAYAHSQGIVHRDLKPANVMLGAFGEVQVMDWGLAKDLPGAERFVEDEAAPSSRSWSGDPLQQTQVGSVLGTYAYMPPEQARGDVDRIDTRSDVFSLGAMLCEILTGKPPYLGATKEELRAQAQKAQLAPVLDRLNRSGVEEALVALAQSCLAPEPDTRPQDAGLVARHVADYRASVQERLHKADQARAAADARVEEEARTRQEAQARAEAERRARRRAVALLVVSGLVLAVGAAGAWWLAHFRTATGQAVTEALDRANQLRRLAQDAPVDKVVPLLSEAHETARGAADRSRAGFTSAAAQEQARQTLKEVEADLALARADQSLLASLLDVGQPREPTSTLRPSNMDPVVRASKDADEQFTQAFRENGLNVDDQTTQELAARFQRRPVSVVREVVAALDNWAIDRGRSSAVGRQRLVELANALDATEPSRQLRAVLTSGRLERARAAWLVGYLGAAGIGGVASLGPLALLRLPTPGVDHEHLRDLARRVNPASDPVAWIVLLSRLLAGAEETAEAELLLRGAITSHPGEVVLLTALARFLEQQRPPRLQEAVEFYRAARSVRPEFGVRLTRALVATGRADQARGIWDELVKGQPNNAVVLYDYGLFLYQYQQTADAEAAYRKAIALNKDFILPYINLGILLAEKNDFAEAEKLFRTATTIASDPGWCAAAYQNLGGLLKLQRRFDEANRAFARAIELAPDSSNPHYYHAMSLL
ncbi:MAG: serine/threonine-protein kinase, partial [Gemmataceae bacterium]|nr:serine/threonine-protein kinase [Gemmataceae bacterium]